MGRPRKPQTITQEEIEDVFPPQPVNKSLPALPEYGNENDDEIDDVTYLNNVLAELGGEENNSGFVTINREVRSPSGKTEDEYIDRMPVVDFSLASLKEKWGAAKYKICVYRDGRLVTRKVIKIAENPNMMGKVDVVQPVAPPVDLTPLVQTMMKGFEAMAAQIAAHAPKPQSRTEWLEEMRLTRELFAAKEVAAPQFNPVEMMKLGIEMGQGASGDGNNAWVNKMIEVFAPVLQNVMEVQATKSQNPIAPSAKPVTPALPAAQPVISTENEEPALNIMIKGYLKMLISAAAQKADVAEYADSTLNMVPESQIADLETMLRADNWMESVTTHVPQIRAHQEWFTRLRNTVLQYIDEDRTESSGLTGNTGSGSVPVHENADTAVHLTPVGDASGTA